RLALHFSEKVQALGDNRLLRPCRMEPIEPLDHSQRATRRETAMVFDHEAHLRSNSIPHGGNDLERQLFFVLRELLPRRAEWIELHGEVAARDHLANPRCELSGCLQATIPAVGISRQFGLAPASEKLIYRLAAGLADQIPHGDLDAADCRHHRGAALVL